MVAKQAYQGRLHWDFYLSVRKQCESLLQNEDQEIRRYREEYEKEIKRPWRRSELKKLLLQIEKSRILMLGDFHALHQSQKAHVRLLRLLSPKKKKILFLECLSAQDQESVDLYMQGKISEGEFLFRVRWKERWGFAWRSYRPIFQWAKKKGIKIYAIDKDLRKHGDESLKIRDTFAASLIAEILEREPESLGIVIIGDYHIASSHLPKSLTEHHPDWPILRVFQNSEPIYFQLLKKRQELDVDVIQFNSWDFGLISVAPWVKWHSLLSHLLEQDEDIAPEDKIYEDLIHFFRLFNQDFGKYPGLDENFDVVTLNDVSFFEQLEKNWARQKQKRLSEGLTWGLSFYAPESHKMILAKKTLNHLAEAAARIRLGKMSTYSLESLLEKKHFLQLMWANILPYFASKWINPKRKTDTIFDWKIQFQNTGDRAYQSALDLYYQAEAWALGRRRIGLRWQSVPESQVIRVSQLLGYYWGEKLYYGLMKGYLKREEVFDLWHLPFSNWSDGCYRVIAWSQMIPEPYPSKRLKV
jgi:uncharacterized iron-regulated protein